MCSPAHPGEASFLRSSSGALTLTTTLESKSCPASRSRYVCEFRAKQLWLTTPFAMKSPVPVVMSYMGSSIPSGSIAATRSLASLLIATPSIDRFRVIAGSVVWKNRMTSFSPPRSRTYLSPLAHPRDSRT